MSIKIFIIGFSMLFGISLFSQESEGKNKPKKYVKKKSFIEDLTNIENPIEMRDPFKKPEPKNKTVVKRKKSIISRTNLDNRPKPRGISLRNVKKINGILMGEKRRVIINEGGKNYILKEGFVDKDGLELKAILPGGIIYVEKIINVYGQEEFLETVVPISK